MKIVEKTAIPLFYFIVFYLAVNTLTLDDTVKKVLITIGIILLTLLGIYFIVSIVSYFLETYWMKKEKDVEGAAV